MIGPDLDLATIVRILSRRGGNTENNLDPRMKAVENFMADQGGNSRLPVYETNVPYEAQQRSEQIPREEKHADDDEQEMWYSPNESKAYKEMYYSKPSYDTQLTPEDEDAFQRWKNAIAPNDSGADYDLRGAFASGTQPDAASGHWPDTYKKPNHPTFSDQSQYFPQAPGLAGRWAGDTYVPNFGGTTPQGEITDLLDFVRKLK